MAAEVPSGGVFASERCLTGSELAHAPTPPNVPLPHLARQASRRSLLVTRQPSGVFSSVHLASNSKALADAAKPRDDSATAAGPLLKQRPSPFHRVSPQQRALVNKPPPVPLFTFRLRLDENGYPLVQQQGGSEVTAGPLSSGASAAKQLQPAVQGRDRDSDGSIVLEQYLAAVRDAAREDRSSAIVSQVSTSANLRHLLITGGRSRLSIQELQLLPSSHPLLSQQGSLTVVSGRTSPAAAHEANGFCFGDQRDLQSLGDEGGKQHHRQLHPSEEEAVALSSLCLADFADMLTPGLFRIDELQKEQLGNNNNDHPLYIGSSSSSQNGENCNNSHAVPLHSAASITASGSMEVLVSNASSCNAVPARTLRAPRHTHPLSIVTSLLVSPWTQHVYGRPERFWMTSRRHLLWRGLSQAQVGTQTTVDARSYSSVFVSLLSIFISEEKLLRSRIQREELSELARLFQIAVFRRHAQLDVRDPLLFLAVQEDDERNDICDHEADNIQMMLQEALWWPIHAAFAAEQLENAKRKYVQSAVTYEAMLDAEVLEDLDSPVY